MNRLERIREAAERAMERPKAPVGRWIRLENVLGRHTNGAAGKTRPQQRHFVRTGRRVRKVWVVVVPAKVDLGARIKVENGKGNFGWWYVATIIPAPNRPDGSVVVTVSKKPVPVVPEESPPALSVEEARKAAAPAKVQQRNPRICEECEGPCRPGAGVCDGCRATSGTTG